MSARPIRPSQARPELSVAARKISAGAKRFVIELSPGLHKRLRQRAADEEKTMRDVILDALERIGIREDERS
jgi:hypothetical protein